MNGVKVVGGLSLLVCRNVLGSLMIICSDTDMMRSAAPPWTERPAYVAF